jgi:xylan 1,4-beta-xylosidase
MLGMTRGQRVESDEGFATADEHGVSVLLWNYSADDLPGDPIHIELEIFGAADRTLIQHYRIDNEDSNTYATWQKTGSVKFDT